MRDLIRWNPFQELTHWHRNIDELFDPFFNIPSWETRIETHPSQWLPPMDTYEKNGRQIVRLDLPGVDPKDIEVFAENNSLIVKGERRRAQEAKEKGYHYSETSCGTFERRLALPRGTETNKLAARYDKGILEISMPLPTNAAGKRVRIQIESDNSDQSEAA
jgi:HSP20 family protein